MAQQITRADASHANTSNAAAPFNAHLQTTAANSAPALTAAATTSTTPSSMSVSQGGLDFIKAEEGFRANAYRDPSGVWTIGYGHTGNVKPGDHVTKAQAEALLRQDIAGAQNAVRQNVKVPLTQGQFDALVSFTFNVGAGAFKKSTLLRKLNAGDYKGAQAEFGRWVHGGGKVLPGLVKRRQAEAKMFGSTGPAKAGNGAAGTTYTIRAGDTLSGVASKFGVTLNALIAANPQIKNPNLIYPGQKIHIPGKNGGAPGAPGAGPVGGAPITYPPYTVYSSGASRVKRITNASQLLPHHDYQTRQRQGQKLEVRDVVLTHAGKPNNGQPIPSPVTGTVISAGPMGTAGNAVVIRAKDGGLVYLFHMSKVDVKAGQRVTYGQTVGRQGSTGHSTGPHVHIEASHNVIIRWVNDLIDGKFDGRH